MKKGYGLVINNFVNCH